MKKIMMILIIVAAFVLPTVAQEWQSTSTMKGAGSVYAPQVTPVGAAYAAELATTTDSYALVRESGGPRKINVYTPDTDPNAPLGDALIPLLLMGMAYAAYIFLRRKKARMMP